MNPILHQIGAVFIPVRDIEKARDWYSDLLGLPERGEIFLGHLYVIPLKGMNLVLDSRIYSEGNLLQVPAFHFNTEDIEQAYEYMKSRNVELTTEIENNHWFNFRDPDGNHLMMCKC
ncbi:Glyoxalase-like domain protein [compost metagenome]